MMNAHLAWDRRFYNSIIKDRRSHDRVAEVLYAGVAALMFPTDAPGCQGVRPRGAKKRKIHEPMRKTITQEPI